MKKRGCILIFLGIALIAVSLGLHLAQENSDQIAGENSRILLDQLQLSNAPVAVPGAIPEMTPEESLFEPAATYSMPEKGYLGYSMIGTLRVPSVEVELPVLSTWSYDLLKVAPCRYSGSVAGEDMILMGHNYKSHFRPLHNVEVGDTVEFEDVHGVVYRYVVAQIMTLHKNEGELLPSDYPLTLFTCTPGGQKRIVVRCLEDAQEGLP